MNNIKYYPQHIALIPDGNRTWAKERGYLPFVGHLEGLNRIVEIGKYIFTQTPIKVYTVWGLSTENLKNRSEEELSYLFELYKKIPDNLFETLKKNKVNFYVAGNKDGLPKHLIDFLEEKTNELKFDSDKYMVICINYGGQDEILRGIKQLIKNKLPPTKENLEKFMDFGNLPRIQLVIRTKQNYAQRLSGFMLWWIGYAQLYFTPKYCPDFTIDEFKKALQWYSDTATSQNYGK